MIELDNSVNFEVDLPLLTKIDTFLNPDNREIELLFTDNETIQTINATHRNINKATDVLSFPYVNMPHAPLGSIVISTNFIYQKAQELHHSIQHESALLFIHGMLHILGMDHETDSGQMRQKEEELIYHFNLPTSLITRMQN